jgi:hypothetical protein
MIPIISPLNFTEVSSSGNLNQKAAEKASSADDMPIQYFKLTGNVSGNLTLDNNDTHKKVILDTNGFDLTNSSGAPLTNNSSTTLDLKGSGDIKSTQTSITTTVTSTTNSGITIVEELDNSTINVDVTSHTFDAQLVNDDRGAGGGPGWGDGTSQVFDPSSNSNTNLMVHESYLSYATLFGGTDLTNLDRSDFAMSFTHAFLEDGTPISGAIVGPGGPSTFDGVSADQPDANTNSTGNGYRYMQWNNAVQGVNKGNSGSFGVRIFIDQNSGNAIIALLAGRGAFNQIKNVDVFGPTAGRRFIFTNNLQTTAVLTGGNPFSSTSVSAGSTGSIDRDSTDGSFSIITSVSGNNDAGRPFAFSDVSTGSGGINVDNYTGTRSTSAL